MKAAHPFLREIGTIIFVSGSGLYLTQITSVSPIYISFLAGSILIFIGLLDFKNCIRIDEVVALSLACLAYTTIAHGINSDPSSIIGYSIAITSGIVAYWALPNGTIGTTSARKSVYAYVYISIALGIIEAIYRIANPSFDRWNDSQIQRMSDENLVFYAYKISSIMYQDSNFVGMWLLFTFLYTLFSPIPFSRMVKTFLTILIMATLSRAAIIGMIIGIVYKLYKKSEYKITYIITGSIVTLAGSIFIISDGSLLTKFEILQSVARYAKDVDTPILIFGSGLGNSIHALVDRSSHGLLMTLLVETGLLGTLLYVLLVAAYLNKAPSMRPAVGIYFFASFSFASFATPYIFCLLALTAKNLSKVRA